MKEHIGKEGAASLEPLEKAKIEASKLKSSDIAASIAHTIEHREQPYRAGAGAIIWHLSFLHDSKYKAYEERVLPMVDPEKIIGVRIPVLRLFSKRLEGSELALNFMRSLPHTFYDEDELHALLITKLKDPQEALRAIDSFLPYVDNWQIADIINPKCLCRALDTLHTKVVQWLSSPKVYTRRFAVRMLMKWFLEDSTIEESMQLVASIEEGEYYVDMVRAWFFAEAMVKNFTKALLYFKDDRDCKLLDKWTHNKALHKAQESLRLSPRDKALLASMYIR